MIIQLSYSDLVFDFTGESGGAIDYTAYDVTLTHDVSNELITFPIPAKTPSVIYGAAADWSGGGVGGAEGFNIAMCSDIFTLRGQFRNITAFWWVYYLVKFITPAKTLCVGVAADYKCFKVQGSSFNSFWKPGTDENVIEFTLQLKVVNE